ncbi:MAG: PA2169 family four-helix-bundle protein [Saprospiraceae bacterium]
MDNPIIVVDKLNELLEKNNDARFGFESAAENVNWSSLKKFFHDKSTQRSQFANELVQEIMRLGGSSPNESGSVAGFLHRNWIGLKAALSSDNEEAVLEACTTGENAALEDYDNVLLDTNLQLQTRQLLEKHRNSIAQSVGKIERISEAL